MAAGVVTITQVIGNTARLVDYWSSDGTDTGHLTPIFSNTGGTPFDVTNQLGLPSGVAPVTGSFIAAGQSAVFNAAPNRPINVYLGGSAYVGVSIALQRSPDSGVTWYNLTINQLQWAVYTGPVSEQPWTESESSVQYRLNCTSFTSATAQTYRISH